MNAPIIPDPCLEFVDNQTPFQVFNCDKMGAGKAFYDVVTVKGSFALSDGPLRLASFQEPIALADEYWEPSAAAVSSLRKAGDAVLYKPSTDVLVTGTARAPGDQPTTDWEAGVVVQRAGKMLLQYSLRATGPRRFRHGAMGWSLLRPEPTQEVPIRYELSYGGFYEDPRDESMAAHEENPCGMGFFDRDAMDASLDYAAPQWEDFDRPVTGINCKAGLAGLGPIARPWRSRLQYAGTYDAAWEARTQAAVSAGQVADYPADFDARFFQCAHPELTSADHFVGDEHITLVGLRGCEWYELSLPCTQLIARMVDGAGEETEEPMALDTVSIDLDRELVFLTWRLTLAQRRDIRAAAIHGRNLS